MQREALLTKQLYRYAAKPPNTGEFTRDHQATDLANGFFNHGNYLAYGFAATTLWVLGIPHGFAVMHGKTRRGALVFDVADLIKDAIVLPWAFICAKEKMPANKNFASKSCKNSPNTKPWISCLNKSNKPLCKSRNHDGDLRQPMPKKSPKPHPPRTGRLCQPYRRQHLANRHHRRRPDRRQNPATQNRHQKYRRRLSLDTVKKPE